MKQKINLKTVIGIIVGIVVAALLQQIVIPKLFAPSIDSQLMDMTSEMNKNCPYMVDSDTRLDNVVPGAGKTIIYNYTLINFNRDDIDIESFESIMRPQILNVVKTNPQMKTLRDNDITFVYNYKDKSSIHISSITCSPKDYQ
jgi:hypothetical protein